MDTSIFKRHGSKVLFALFALTTWAGTGQAALQLTATATATVNCSTISGPGTAATIVVKPVANLTTNSIIVGFVAPGAGLTVTPPSSTTLNSSNQAAGLTYTVNTSGSCTGAVSGPTTLQFTVGATPINDVTSVITDTVYAYKLSSTAVGAVTCSTSTGLGTIQSFTLKPSLQNMTTSSTPLVVTFSAPSWLNVTPPTVTTITSANQSTGLTYTVTLFAGCAGATAMTAAATPIQFSIGGTSDVIVSPAVTVTATSTGLSAPATTVTCTSAGIAGAAQTVSVTSAASGGTPYTIDTSSIPAWLTVTPTTGGTAGSSPSTFTVQATGTTCGSITSGTVYPLHLLNAPAPFKVVNITLTILPASILTSLPTTVAISYTKGSGTPGYQDVVLKSTNSTSPFFTINTATLPIWLTVDSTTGTVTKSVRFSSTTVADTLAPGTYSATVGVKVSGYFDYTIPVSLSINNKAPKLSIQQPAPMTWVIGSPLPTPSITALSTDSPIPYSITTGGSLAPIIAPAQLSGLAYNFGSQIGVSFGAQTFASAQPGNVLTGTVTFTWGAPAQTVVVTLQVTVQAPGATLSGLSPASLPIATTGQVFIVYLTGSGFVTGTDPTQATKVGILASGAGSIISDTAIAVNVQNASNIQLTITIPASDPLLGAFAGTGGNVTFGVCNPAGTTCSAPTGTATLSVGSGPLIQAVTSASTFSQVTPPAAPNVAPYDMVTIFGANFCSSSATGTGFVNCGTNTILFGSPTGLALQYPTTLSNDTGSTPRQLSVIFQTHDSSHTLIGAAPLLFATNGQINLLVPGALTSYITTGPVTQVEVVVSFAASPAVNKSTPFLVNVVATDPGVFTVGADGQGPGAILSADWHQVSATNPAGARAAGSGLPPSDTVLMYVTGLGAPDSTGDDTAAGTGFDFPGDCVGALTSGTGYLAAMNAANSLSLTNIDGMVINPAFLNANRLPPCMATNDVPTVKIGGIDAPVAYAGFVATSIAGLYQINVTVPTPSALGITSLTNLPVVITTNGVASQAGVTMWVAPRLGVTGPSGAGLLGTVGVPWSTTLNIVTATQGTAAYSYAITSGLLPTGLTLVAGTGPNAGSVVITGTPAANTAGTYLVTVTATDATPNIPLSGSVTFTITVQGGLFMTATSPTYNFINTYGQSHASFAAVTATGGAFPYVYTALSGGSSLPLGLTINKDTGVIGIASATPDGTYHIVVTATDSLGVTGTSSFDVVVNLAISQVLSGVTPASGTASLISTVTAVGSNPVTYALDTATAALSWVILDANAGTVSITSGAPASTTITATVTATDGTLGSAAVAGTASIPVVIAIP